MTTVLLPVRIEFESGARTRVGEECRALGCRSVLIVTDKGVRAAGLLDGILTSLRSAGIQVELFDGVVPDPDEACATRASEVFLDAECDGILAVGGGGSIDTAKASVILATNLVYEGVNHVKKILPPLIVIPKVAILDPDLLLTLPPKLIAETGMDALTHAMESYTNRVEHWYAEACGLHAMIMISKNIRPAVVNRDPPAISAMLYASTLAGVAFTLSRLGLVHAMSHPVSGFAGVPHGLANAVFLPYIMDFNLVGNVDKYARVAIALGEAPRDSTVRTTEAGVQAVVKLNHHLGIPDGFKDLGVRQEMFPDMIRDTFRSGNIPINPRTVTVVEVERLYRALYEGNLPV